MPAIWTRHLAKHLSLELPTDISALLLSESTTLIQIMQVTRNFPVFPIFHGKSRFWKVRQFLKMVCNQSDSS